MGIYSKQKKCVKATHFEGELARSRNLRLRLWRKPKHNQLSDSKSNIDYLGL